MPMHRADLGLMRHFPRLRFSSRKDMDFVNIEIRQQKDTWPVVVCQINTRFTQSHDLQLRIVVGPWRSFKEQS